jgi:hypothetical protein
VEITGALMIKSLLGKFIGTILFMAVLTGCATPTGDLNSYPIHEIFEPSDGSELTLVMGEGKLNLIAGDDNLVEGTIQNNFKDWNPSIQRSSESLKISQGDISQIVQLPPKGIVNDWNIQLSNQPTDLFIEAKGYFGDLNLTKANLRTFRILDSFSQTEIKFEDPNPVNMSIFEVGSASSTLKLSGLANANFDLMNFRGVGGNYTLDFSGQLQHDTPVNIVAGLGNIRVEVPREQAAVVHVSGNTSRFDLQGAWVKDNGYRNQGSGKQFTIDINRTYAK